MHLKWQIKDSLVVTSVVGWFILSLCPIPSTYSATQQNVTGKSGTLSGSSVSSTLDSDLPRFHQYLETAVNSIVLWMGFPVMGLVPLSLEIKTRTLKAPSAPVCSSSPHGIKDRQHWRHTCYAQGVCRKGVIIWWNWENVRQGYQNQVLKEEYKCICQKRGSRERERQETRAKINTHVHRSVKHSQNLQEPEEYNWDVYSAMLSQIQHKNRMLYFPLSLASQAQNLLPLPPSSSLVPTFNQPQAAFSLIRILASNRCPGHGHGGRSTSASNSRALPVLWTYNYQVTFLKWSSIHSTSV